MAKKKRKCNACALFDGTGRLGPCRFGAGHSCVVAAENTACKMFVPLQQPKSKEQAVALTMEAGGGVDEPAPGSAPFCNEFAKCNNAEGCDTCREFTLWLADREKRFAAPNSQKRSSK